MYFIRMKAVYFRTYHIVRNHTRAEIELLSVLSLFCFVIGIYTAVLKAAARQI